MARKEDITRFEIGKTYSTIVGAFGYEREDLFTVKDRTAHAVMFGGEGSSCEGWATIWVDPTDGCEAARVNFGLADEWVYANEEYVEG